MGGFLSNPRIRPSKINLADSGNLQPERRGHGFSAPGSPLWYGFGGSRSLPWLQSFWGLALLASRSLLPNLLSDLCTTEGDSRWSVQGTFLQAFLKIVGVH